MFISAYSYVSVNHIITSKHILYLKNRSNYIEQNKQVLKYKESSDSWIILNEIENVIKNKILNVGTPLKSWGITINRGILTGLNEAFIIDEDTKNRLIEEDPKSAEIIRPILRGRDIEKYSYRFANLYLINVHNGIKEKGIEPVNIDNYPAIKEHLDKFLDKLKKRQDKGITCYNLRNCAYMDDFFEQVIAWQRITNENKFCLTEKGFVVLDSMAFISNFGNNKNLLLAILNSKLIMYWIKQNVHEYGDTGYRLANQYVEEIPICSKFDNNIFNRLNELVEEIKNSSIHEKQILQDMIDNIIFELYKLSREEIEYIKNKG